MSLASRKVCAFSAHGSGRRTFVLDQADVECQKRVLLHPSASPAGMTKKKILIVEDVEFNRDLLVQLLGDDFHLSLAADGKEGLEIFRREQPDIVRQYLGV